MSSSPEPVAGAWEGASGRRRSPLWVSLRVGLIYVSVAALWIVASDAVLGSMVSDARQLTVLQTAKGWMFVAVSGAFIVLLVRAEIARSRRSEDRFRSLVEQTLVGVYVVRRGRFVYANPRLAEAFGYTPREMVESVQVRDVVCAADRDEVLESLQARERGEAGAARQRFTGVRRDGREVRVDVFGRGIELGGQRAVIGVLLDRTDEARLEDQLQRAQRMEAIGQLTGAVAHDFNNLLTAIMAPLDLCIAGLEADDPLRWSLGEVRETAERGAALTRKLLAFSRKQIDQPVVLDLNKAVGGLSPMLNHLLPKRVALHLEPGHLERNVRVDPSSLEQVIVNLVVNARDAMPDGGDIRIRTFPVAGDEPSIRRRDEPTPGHFVCLEVADGGVGMDDATRSRIFEPFFTTKRGGTGLGLATVFGLVTKAGGFVRVTSSPGEGSSFQVFLPAVAEMVEVARRKPDPERPGSGDGNGRGPFNTKHRVLVVDDDDRVRAVIVQALERVGFAVAAAGDFAEALETGTGPEDVDLLLTDVNLPDGSGVDLARSFLERCPQARVVFMSGYSSQEVSTEMKSLEGSLFLEKPFALDTLTERVGEALRGGTVRPGRRA